MQRTKVTRNSGKKDLVDQVPHGTYSWRMPPSRIPLTPWQFWRTDQGLRGLRCAVPRLPRTGTHWNVREPHQSPWWQFHRQPWINGINHLTAPHQERLRACLNHNSCTVLLVDSGGLHLKSHRIWLNSSQLSRNCSTIYLPTIFVRERITAE